MRNSFTDLPAFHVFGVDVVRREIAGDPCIHVHVALLDRFGEYQGSTHLHVFELLRRQLHIFDLHLLHVRKLPRSILSTNSAVRLASTSSLIVARNNIDGSVRELLVWLAGPCYLAPARAFSSNGFQSATCEANSS
jgi:hypothetical protein